MLMPLSSASLQAAHLLTSTPITALGTASNAPEPHMGSLERYSSNHATCQPFLTHELCAALHFATFDLFSEKAKVVYAISHLSGRARLWGST